jgi:quercetin dioxygenase-like cupin family protein
MDQPYTFLPNLAAEAEPPKRGIHSQTITKQESFELVLFAMAPGEQLSEHTSARPAIVHVLSGEGELTVASDRYSLERDAWLYMPPRTPHAIVARSALVFALYLLAS